MNYGAIRDRSLQLLNQYSIAGDNIPASYNNQDDYIKRIPALINDAQVYIATTAKRIPAELVYDLSEQDTVGGNYALHLPSDLYELQMQPLTLARGGVMEPFCDFEKIGNTIYVPQYLNGFILLSYFRFPQQLENAPDKYEPDDDDELDNTLEVQSAIPYYVAAHIGLYDDPITRDVLIDEFEARLVRMSEEKYATVSQVEDVMGGGICYEC